MNKWNIFQDEALSSCSPPHPSPDTQREESWANAVGDRQGKPGCGIEASGPLVLLNLLGELNEYIQFYEWYQLRWTILCRPYLQKQHSLRHIIKTKKIFFFLNFAPTGQSQTLIQWSRIQSPAGSTLPTFLSLQSSFQKAQCPL